MIMIRRLRFFAAMPTRGTSIGERFDANPVGRTIVSSFGFRCGITVRSKLSKCPTEVDHRICRAYQWHCGGDHEVAKQTASTRKSCRASFRKYSALMFRKRGASVLMHRPRYVQRHRPIIAVNQRELAALANNYRDRLHISFRLLAALIAMFVPTARKTSQYPWGEKLRFIE